MQNNLQGALETFHLWPNLPQQLQHQVCYNLPGEHLIPVATASKNCRQIVSYAILHHLEQLQNCLCDFEAYNDKYTLGKCVVIKWQDIYQILKKEVQTKPTGCRHLITIYNLGILFWDYVYHGFATQEEVNKACASMDFTSGRPLLLDEAMRYYQLEKSEPRNCYMSTLAKEGKNINPDRLISRFTLLFDGIYVPAAATEITERMQKVWDNLEISTICIRPSVKEPGLLTISWMVQGVVSHWRVGEGYATTYTKFFNNLFFFSAEITGQYVPLLTAERLCEIANSAEAATSDEELETKQLLLAQQIEALPYFYKHFTSTDAECFLTPREFCLRFSSQRNSFVLSYKESSGACRHHVIRRDERGEIIINNNKYSSITQFIENAIQAGLFTDPLVYICA